MTLHAVVSPEARISDVLLIRGTPFTVLPEGALWHDEERMLIVADLHLEKGSAYAARGRGLMPPYDTAATLALLGRLISRFDPLTVVALGDSFHDSWAGERIDEKDVETLCALQKSRDWLWIAGNHDPEPPSCVEGDWLTEYRMKDVVLRHEPTAGVAPGEIAGHLHPVAKIYARGAGVRRRCVATDGVRAVLPAFGVYTGGLNVCDLAFGKLFRPGTLWAWMLGANGVYRMPESRLAPDGH
jgi:DNA ligase-associated metallophosphoesterase